MPENPVQPDTPAQAAPPDSAPAASVWRGRKVIVALSGGIACYKMATLVSRLAQAGADIRVLMTPAAIQFIAPLTFQSLSGKPVATSIWEAVDFHDSQHIGLARWCELFILAPASADIMARLAAGITDDIVTLTASALPRATPVLLAPAMNAEMWANPVVQRNVAALRELLGYRTVGPAEGWQACRTSGAGRMSEAEAILEAAALLLKR
jgi:phosphopantothenoylcysteine decarboxylase/phosphopantothenate--cysteine ligase